MCEPEPVPSPDESDFYIEKKFDYCEKVDLHCLNPKDSIKSVISVAGEHGFRGVVVPLSRLEQLVVEINRPNYGCKSIIPIALLDYPFGDSSLDVRSYMLHAAREKGAEEAEIVCPYSIIANGDFRRVREDAKNIMVAANKVGISVKYIMDQANGIIDDSARVQLCRIISNVKIPIVSTSCGFFDKNIDHADMVIRTRNVKQKTGCQIKTYVSSNRVEEVSSFIKAGVDLIGLEWKIAPHIIHAYEEMLSEKN